MTMRYINLYYITLHYLFILQLYKKAQAVVNK